MFDARKVKDEIVQWIRQYFAENGKDCVAVIGISGGKDSSIVAALCCEALGKECVFGVLLPQGDRANISDALKLVKHLGITHKIINIHETVNSLLGKVSAAMYTEENAQAIINTPARIRMTALYAVSAYVHGRVANTSNLSEDYVGYATKFGDSAGDFSPLSSLTVTEVKQVGRELWLPDELIDKVPEDGLCGKTDEENLGFTYDVLDHYIREGMCDDPSVKEKIDKLHTANQHKFKPMPVYKPTGVKG